MRSSSTAASILRIVSPCRSRSFESIFVSIASCTDAESESAESEPESESNQPKDKANRLGDT